MGRDHRLPRTDAAGRPALIHRTGVWSPYEHGEEISTIIPSDVITLGDTMYLHAVVNQGFGSVIWSGIWTSRNNGASWHDSGARSPADAYDKMWQLATWDLGPDSWIYVYTSEFLRESPMILHRVRPQHITRPDAHVLDHPTQNLRAKQKVTLLHGTDWDSPDVNDVAQLYGSYVIPGSHLHDTHLTVSQWNTSDSSVYHVMQYRFEGLDRIGC